jgi:hypothetical protein
MAFHPVQANRPPKQLPEAVTRAAYEVYCHVYGPQPAMMDLEGRGCRGGFSVGEIIAFLYARPFPKSEWRDRVDEALAAPPAAPGGTGR